MDELVARLCAHPDVRAVRWRPASRSLTIERAPGTGLAEIVDHLPDAPPRQDDAPAGLTPPPQPLWRQMLVPGIALGAGLVGVGPLSAPAIAACALPIARRAVRSLKKRHLNIDVLDTAAATLLIGTGDFLAAGVSVALIETGERIRERAAGQARHVLGSWITGDSRGVRVLRNGSEPRIPIGDVVPDDCVVVYAGETVPVDGVVASGEALIDERAWTGEPMPRAAHEGDSLLSGSTVQDGRVVINVIASGSNTRAGRLAAAVEDAIAANTHVTDLARRIADRFVLPVLFGGGLVFAGTGDAARLVSMLIVDFGTGIRVSVPTSILTTMISGARHGVLFRGGRSIEALATVDTVIFDKTGTLTTGRPAVSSVVTANGWRENDLLRLAAAAEGHFPHPLSRAVRRAARRRGLDLPEPDTARYRPGLGVVAVVEGRQVLVGERRLLEDEGVDAPGLQGTSSSIVMVAVDGRYAGRIRLRDRIRSDTPGVIDALRHAGIRHLWLATGDRAPAARAVAKQLGLDGFSARMMPEDKAALVRSLREQGRKVAVVGDGINDAAAMADAHVGIAVTHGADLARETADVVLSGDDLRVLLIAVELSRRAMGLVHENVALVVAPNAAALGLATAGLLQPLGATLVNNGTTLVAGLNGLRPLRYRPANSSNR